MASVERDSKLSRRPWASRTHGKCRDYKMPMGVLNVYAIGTIKIIS